MGNTALKNDFVEYLEAPAALIDENGLVFKTNQKLKSENHKFSMSESQVFNPLESDLSEWKKSLNSCLANGSADFVMKSGSHRCVLTRVNQDGKKIILLSFVELKKQSPASLHVIGSETKTETSVLPQDEPLQKEFTTFVSSFGHAINNPLTVITTRSQMLKLSVDMQKPVTTEMLTQFLEKMEFQSNRIKLIVEAMRTLTKYPTPDEYVDQEVNALVDEAYSQVAEQLREKNIEFVFNNEQKEKWINCKPAEIVQTLVALMTNSIEALALTENPSPHIEINFVQDDKFVHFYVSDNGPGLKDEAKEKMFKPFYTTKTSNGATAGLGLSIGLKVAKSYGGDLVRNPSKPGTCFDLSLLRARVDQLKSHQDESVQKSS